MATTPQFVTQATNFTSAVGGQVDPRTGLYNVTIHLGKATGNKGIGPTLPLTVQYSPINRANVGLGIGWNLLGVTTAQLSASSPVLTVSTGEQYPLSGNPETVNNQTVNIYSVTQQTLQSFKWTWDSTDSGGTSYYWLAHKSGDMEYVALTPTKGYVKELYTAAGHKLTFEWDKGSGDDALPYPLLYTVTDGLGKKLFDVPEGYGPGGVSFSFMPDSSSETYGVDISIADNMTTGVTINAAGCDPQSWEFKVDYPDTNPDHPWGQWIVGIAKGPGGYKEILDYSLTHELPSGASPNYIPCVKTFTRKPMGGQADIVSNYTYSANNYLGGPSSSGITWRADVDPLLATPYSDAYVYTSTETQKSNNNNSPDVVITRTYNQFHLQKQVDTVSEGNTQTTVNGYQMTAGQTSDNQVAWYQLPTSKTNTWNQDAAETTQYTWDDFGNPLTQVDPDKLTTMWQYYPATGSGSDCPPEPNGFCRFVQWQIVDPSQVKSGSWLQGTATVQQTNYKYAVQDGFTGWTTPLVLRNFAQNISATKTDKYGNLTSPTTLSQTTYKYWSASAGYQGSDAYDASRLYVAATTHYANDGTGGSYDSEEDYDYQHLDGTDTDFPYPNGLKTTHTVKATGVDGKQLSVTDTQATSIFTGRTLKQIDAQGNNTSYQYDALGRQAKRILDGDDANYTNILTYEYSIDDQGNAPFRVTQIDINHNKIRYTSDGMARPYQVEVNDPDNGDVDTTDDNDIKFTISTKSFDGLGRLATHTTKDYAFDPNSGQHNYALTRTLAYDGWGQVKSTTYSNGLVENSTYDPIAKTITSWHSSTTDGTVTGTQKTYFDYNASRKPYKTELYYAGNANTPYSTSYKFYDGLHRLRKDTDPLNNSTQYDYDFWHRVQNTTLPDNTIVARSYSPDSPEKRVTNIQVTATPGDQTSFVSPGMRQFDGLGRVQSKWLGKKEAKRVWSYNYGKDSDTRPTSVVDPDTVTRSYVYDYRLGEAVKSVTTPSITQNFQYDCAPGLLQQADEANSATWNYKTFPSGRLKTETYGNSQTTMDYSYTLSGAPYSFTHPDNAVQTITRDPSGRITSVSDGTVTVTPIYDGTNRLRGWTAISGSHTLKTDLGGYLLDGGKASDYVDDFGRETKRVIQDSMTGNTWKIQQQWNANNLITSRTMYVGGNQSVYESYVYDPRNRLKDWRVIQYSGGDDVMPHDRYGNTLTRQQYTIDPLNNITQVISRFADNSVNTAKFNFDNPHDPCLLTGGSNTHPTYPKSFTVTYDNPQNNVTAGRIVNDGMGTTFEYDDLGRVVSASSQLTKSSGSYTYDAHNRLSSQSIQGQNDAIQFYYRANVLVNLIQGSNQARLFQSPIGGATAQTNTGENAGSWLLGTNQLGSVLNASDGNTTETRAYSAYGEEKIQASS